MIPAQVKELLVKSKSAIQANDFRNIAYKGKVYTINYSKNAGGYSVIFSGYSEKYNNKTPLLFTWSPTMEW